MRQKIFLLFALLCAVAQGAWADDGWSSASSYDKDSDADKPTHYDTYGGRSDVYVIKTAANYLYVMDKPQTYCNKNIYLDINVDVSSKTWTNLDNNILGVYRYLESGGSGYRGTFYGNGHTIRINLDYESYSSYKGPFGVIAEGGKVQDLNVEGTIYLKKMDDGNGTDLVGGICGENNGTIENCSVSASVSSEDNYLGGITGRNTSTGTISNCRVSGNVSSNSRLVGGIAGENNGTISNCWVSGNVSSDWKNSSVAATAKVGGIAGENNGTLEYCCMSGNVTNDDADVGGIVGDNSGHTISHCTFYGTRSSTHDQDNIYAGDSGTEDYCFGIFNQSEWNAASGKDLFRKAIKYPYAVNVNTVGPGTIRTWAADEYDVTRTYPNATFSLNVTSGTMARYTLTDADGNNIDLQGHANDWSSFWFVMPKKNVTATVYFYADWPTQGAGTVDDPYIISSADDWNKFANNVSCGRPYSGSHVKLTNNINVTTKAGGTFSGTFDGDGKTITANISGTGSMALFNRLNGGTIKNLTVAGGISGGQHTAALLVSLGNDGTNLVENCVITANVNCSESHMGGFLAHGNESNITFRGCVFKGKMTGGSTAKGVFYGWGSNSASGTRSITDCLYIMADGQDTDGLDLAIAESNGTFAVSNCYKTASAGSQGTQVYSISGGTGVSVANAGVAGSTYNVSGLTFCNIGLQCGDVAYAANGNTVSLTIGSKSGYTTSGYTASAGTLSGTGNPYTLTMPGSNVTISASECSANALTPDGSGNYLINSVDDWNTFCAQIERDTNTFSGKTVKLTDDISVETMAGVWSDTQSERRVFSGTFDGDGHTLTINVSNQGRFAAPFKCVSDATIRNLRTAGTIDGTGNSDGKLLAGIVGVSFGSTTISGCVSSVTLTTNFGEDAAMAGIVAGTKGGSLTIAGCVFDGTMTGASNTRCAGIAGFEYEATTTTITNTLFAPATLTVSTTDDTYTKTFTRDGDATITNCYYTKVLGAAQGTQAIVATTAPPFLGALLHDYGFVKVYAAGLLMDGNYYYDARIITSESTTLTTGTYTVNGNVSVPSRIQINGTVVLNLSEGATLHAPKGIEVSDINNNELTINGPGALTIDNCETGKSGIGANRVGTIIINGGTINVAGGPSAAGIGGDIENIYGGNITINGGVVNAVGGYHAAGIGGGRGRMNTNASDNIGLCGTININGGQVTASGGGNGPGIGPGYTWLGYSSGNLTFQWTNREEDFVYSTGYVTGVEPEITLNSITFAKQFIIEGTATIATSSNIGGQKIVPYATEQLALTGAGTEGNPWHITSTADWNAFAQNVIAGNNYSGQYVQLDTDIEIARGVGGYDENVENARPFSGTFLGNGKTLTAAFSSITQGAAPFRYISGATIKNLNVAGTITSNQYYTSGLVGFAYGTNLIEGCIVTATINQNNDYAGGFVGHGKTSATTIKDCIFSGAINGSNNVVHYLTSGASYYGTTHNVGGFWCYGDEGSTLTIQNCLEKGTFTTIDGMHPMGLQNGTVNVTSTYYLTPQSGSLSHPVVNGAYRAYTVNTVEGEIMRSLVLVDGNTYYTPCIISNIDESYHRTGSSVSVTPAVTASDGTTQLTLGTDFTATLNGDDVAAFPINISTLGIKTLTITGQGNCNGTKSVSFVVYGFNGEGTAENPYTISNTDEWDAFVFVVSTGNNFSGKYVSLDADISVTTPVGYRVSDSDNKPFSGTFLGDGHTITAALAIDGKQGLAPFRCINGATIRDLKVAGTIASNQNHTAGIAGFASGTNTIEDCLVTATLNVSSNYAGGIIGHGLNSATTIRGCVFAGTVNGVDGNRGNIGGIWGWSSSGTPALVNCLEAGTYTNIASMHPMGLQNGSGTITNCYYMNPQVGSPQNACTVSGAKQAYTAATAPANLGSEVQDCGMVKAYQNGILVGGTYYVAPATVTLADNADNSTTISNANGCVANVTLADRTLYKDGAWNTICLPFNVTLDGSPLAGATARPLTSASISGSTLNLSFGTAVDELVSGTPYIIKWEKASGYDEASEETRDLKAPAFSGVTISSDLHPYDNGEEKGDDRVRFLGTYESKTFGTTDNTILLMGAANTLYYPTAGAGLGAQRAYFKIGDDGALLARRLTAFNIDFGDDEATGIISLTPDPSPKGEGSDYWYSLDGRKLSGKPSRAGVYINNGVKVVIK